MKCPFCLEGFTPAWTEYQAGRDKTEDQTHWILATTLCPNPRCGQMTIIGKYMVGSSYRTIQLRPKVSARATLPPGVPDGIAADYREAVEVLSASPKASAALSRRNLQHLLREYGGTEKRDLADQIEDVIPSLPSHLADAIDGVRQIGLFGAHPMKSQHSGEIVDVEPGEAEWLLDTVEALIDFYIVAPARLKVRREAVNAKLAEVGKPELKGAPTLE